MVKLQISLNSEYKIEIATEERRASHEFRNGNRYIHFLDIMVRCLPRYEFPENMHAYQRKRNRKWVSRNVYEDLKERRRAMLNSR